MIGYASRTNTRRNVEALAAAGWGWIVGPLDRGGPILAGMPHALDNGAWPAHAQGVPWDEAAFLRALDTYGPGAKFIVVPDIVAGGRDSLERSAEWLPRLARRPDLREAHLLIAVQDGMEFDDVAPWLGGRVGLFIGGSTEWKEQAILPWGQLARRKGCYLHVGRVNSIRRIAICAAAGADSFDGTSCTRYAKMIPRLDGARRQHAMRFDP